MIESSSALERQISLILQTISPVESQMQVDLLHARVDRDQWFQQQLDRLGEDTTTGQPPHAGKCGCPPVATSGADQVLLEQLEVAREQVREAEGSRDRLVALALQASALPHHKIAQAAGLNPRTIRRRDAELEGVDQRAAEYLRLQGEIQGQGRDALRQALLDIGGPSTKSIHGIDAGRVARRLGISRRTVERWLVASREGAGPLPPQHLLEKIAAEQERARAEQATQQDQDQ